MATKVKTSLSLKIQLFRMRREFKGRAGKIYRQGILSSMSKGRSPVLKGRWDKPYSKSYKDAIKGKVTFRTVNGRVIPISGPDPGVLIFGKKVRPVNLKLSGQLWNTLRVKSSGTGKLKAQFKDKIADFHNRLGIPSPATPKRKGGVSIRRMLPTFAKEEFNRDIQKRVQRLLERIVKKHLKP